MGDRRFGAAAFSAGFFDGTSLPYSSTLTVRDPFICHLQKESLNTQ
jgi:hypothetical protein